jgi:8-oxo-dGTP diphosphatase
MSGTWMSMKRFLLKIWYIFPLWMQRIASVILRQHFQVAVGAMIFNEQGQLLLCRHTYRRLHPWGLPGGGLHFGEDPLDGIKREVLEETGMTVKDARLLLVDNSREIHLFTLTYLCSGVSGTFVKNEEVSYISYFDVDKLPDFFPEHQATIDKCLSLLQSGK